METPLPDLLEEAKRMVSGAVGQGLTLRLVGGIAVRFTCPSAAEPPLQRSYKDIDLVGRASETKGLKKLFQALGYVPRETFNAMQGGRRMIFNDMVNQRRVDIFQDYFEMCHKFDLRRRLELRDLTLPLSDLLATKLQIVKPDDKDYRDMTALLSDHPLEHTEGPEVINASRLVELCSDDWGMWKTFTLSLERLVGNLGGYPLASYVRGRVEERAKGLANEIKASPKSLKWKLRARIGEKAAWYEDPEADASVVDSRF